MHPVARKLMLMVLVSMCWGAMALAAGHSSSHDSEHSYDWHNVKVGGGGYAPGIIFSTVEPGLAYLRTDMGGAYRWDSALARWEPLQDGMAEGSYFGIESIAADPVDADTVYLAAGMHVRAPAAILRSTDRGVNWTVTPVPFGMGGNQAGRGMGERLAIDPYDNRRLFFGSRGDGLWMSEDRGANWTKVESFPLAGLGHPTERWGARGGLSFVLFDPSVKGRIFVASADPGARHLFRSDDGGVSWSAVEGGPGPELLPVKGVVGGDGILTITYCDEIGPSNISRGAVWRLDAAKGKWRDVTPPKGAEAPTGGYMGVAVSAQDPNVIAVATTNRFKPVDTVWRSSDGGQSWDELWTHSVRDVSATPFLDMWGKANFGHWISGLAIDPFDPGHVAYVTGATIYATREFDVPGTMHWFPWTEGIEQTAIISMISPTKGAPLVSGFGDIAGFRHDDLTVSPPWGHGNPLLTNTNSLDYAGLAPEIMVRSGNTHSPVVEGSSLAWSGDGGARWQPLDLPADGAPHTDGRLKPEQTGSAAISVSADGSTFLVETIRPILSRDRGKNWSRVEGLPSRVRVTADKVDPRYFYAIDFEANRLVRSTDGGAHFSPVNASGLPGDLSPARSTNRETPNPLVAVPGKAGALWLNIGGALYRSLDFGAHWQRTGKDIAVARFGLGRAAPGSRWPALYVFGEREGRKAIWRSIDGGVKWREISDAAHQWGMRIRVITGDPKRFGRVYVGTDGRGILYGDPKAISVKSGEK